MTVAKIRKKITSYVSKNNKSKSDGSILAEDFIRGYGSNRFSVHGCNVSCGVRELSGVGFPTVRSEKSAMQEKFFSIKDEILRGDSYYPHYIFSNPLGDGYDGLFVVEKFIKDNNLGEFISTEYVESPSTGHDIAVGVWTISPDGYDKWYNTIKEQVEKLEIRKSPWQKL